MKRLNILLAALGIAAVSCKPEVTPDVPPTPTDWTPMSIELTKASGERTTIELESAVAFVSEAGMYTMYVSDVAGLDKATLTNEEYSFPASASVLAVSTVFDLVGQKVDISTQSLHWMLSLQIPELYDMGMFEGNLEADVTGGYFTMSIDNKKNTSSLEFSVDLVNGDNIHCIAEGTYTPGGENETLFIWNNLSRPVRAAFYDNTGANVVLYFTNGQIDYGEELKNTTYARVVPSAKICDGKAHDIAAAIKSGDLEFMVRDFDSEWDMVSGSISIQQTGDFEYTVRITDAEGEDRGKTLADRALKMYFQGTLKDVHESRPVDNKLTKDGNTYYIKSCVVDLSGTVAAIYMVQTAGITTVDAAKAANPLVINFSTSKFGTSIGLSTDKENFAITYEGNRWDRENLDTGSFICHEYNEQTGLLHCQLANICLKVTYKTVLKLEYKGTPTYVK